MVHADAAINCNKSPGVNDPYTKTDAIHDVLAIN